MTLNSKARMAILLVATVLGVAACNGGTGGTTNIISDMLITNRSARPSDCFSTGGGRPPARACSPEEIESLFFLEIGKEIVVHPQGAGRCARATVDFGDGTPPSEFLNPVPQSGQGPFTWLAPHTYAGWPGKKLIRVKGDSSCLGEATKEVTVGRGPNGEEDFRQGFCVGPRCPSSPTTVCSAATTASGPMPPIRAGSGVRIETNGREINYGSNQIYGASGAVDLAPPGYLFPNRRKFSIVYRIGTTDFQGEAGPVTFVADQTAPLEICTNDNPSMLSDNVGDMVFTITVNERSAR
jgi:hypothetical protein